MQKPVSADRAAAPPTAAANPAAASPATASPAVQSAVELMAAVAERRDRAAFAQLYGHFAPRLKAYLMRQGADEGSAEDIIQDTMLTVWHRAASFDPAKAGVATWIYTIARNKRIDRLRRERYPEAELDDPALVPDAPAAADVVLAASQAEARLRRAIGTLPAEQAELLQLAFFQDKSHSAIAEERGLPLGTVKSRIRLALQRLRHDLKDSV
jgi:RNA polymerase sigma factor (sigma-70 family)